jgi:putative Holliday junction resolvase
MGVYTDEGKDGWNMRIMAVDFGDRRTGVAVSDLSGTLAGDTFVISDWQHERVAEKIAEEAQKRGVSRLVLGYPKNMDGSYGPRAEKSAAFAALLRERHGLDVVLWDERLTTVDAHRVLSEVNVRGKKRKGTVDAVAAALILESYLASIR